MALDMGLLKNLGDTIKNAGGAVEDSLGAVGGIFRKALDEMVKTGTSLEDGASELAEHGIKAVSDAGGNVEEAAKKFINQTLEAGGSIGENATGVAAKVGSGVVKGVGGLGATTVAQVKNLVNSAVPGRDTSEDPTD